MDEFTKADIRKEIADFKAWATGGDAAREEEGKLLLKSLEEDAEAEVDSLKAKMDKRPTEENKKNYYDALKIYEFIGAELGDSSPAKAAAKARAIQAAAKAAVNTLADRLGEAKSVQDVVRFIKDASKNTSPLPELMGEARTDDTMKDVLGYVADDKKLAKQLAKALLDAKTEAEAAAAFAEIWEANATQGTEDPEVIMRAKLSTLIKKYVMGGELAIAKIKDQFNKNAQAAQTEQQLQQAL